MSLTLHERPRPVDAKAMALNRAETQARGSRSLGGNLNASRIGLDLEGLVSYREWRDLGGRICRLSKASAWWLGDWIVFGQQRYGRRYHQAVEATGLDYQTLRNYATVARKIEMSRRRESLSFQHHAEVCALPPDEQDMWLDRAEAGSWTRKQLRSAIRGARDGARSQRAVADALCLRVSVVRKGRWEQAAEAAGLDVRTWAIGVLDAAADQLLEEAGAAC